MLSLPLPDPLAPLPSLPPLPLVVADDVVAPALIVPGYVAQFALAAQSSH